MNIRLKQYGKRKIPRVDERRAILKKQDGTCFYCGMTFGELFQHRGVVKVVRLAWDHLLPWSYCLNNDRRNFVAACSICNGLKHARIFDSVEEAVEYVREQREKRGVPLLTLRGKFCEEKEVAAVLSIKVQSRTFLDDT